MGSKFRVTVSVNFSWLRVAITCLHVNNSVVSCKFKKALNAVVVQYELLIVREMTPGE